KADQILILRAGCNCIAQSGEQLLYTFYIVHVSPQTRRMIMKIALVQDNKIVKASEVVDVNAVYTCPYCRIPLKLKSVDGKVAPYFSKKISYLHAADCPYAIPYNQLDLSKVADRRPI